MKLTGLKTSILAGVLFTGVSIPHTSVEASPTERNTKATITFETLLPPPIVDPTNPDVVKPPGPDEGNVNTESGELTLDFAPNLYFGSHEIGKDGMYEYPVLVNADKTANPDEETSDPFIQITDRQVKPGNWDVSVKVSSFENDQTGASSLAGAYLTFLNGQLKKPTVNTTAVAPVLNNSITALSDETDVNVLSAADGQGELTWVAHWIPDTTPSSPSIKLAVPAGTMKKGTHTASLTWTLASSITP